MTAKATTDSWPWGNRSLWVFHLLVHGVAVAVLVLMWSTGSNDILVAGTLLIVAGSFLMRVRDLTSRKLLTRIVIWPAMGCLLLGLGLFIAQLAQQLGI